MRGGTLQEIVAEAVRRDGRSLRRIAYDSGGSLSRDTLSRVTAGVTGHVTPRTLTGLHEQLAIPLARLRAANGQASRGVPPTPFTLPARADGLTLRERRIVLAVVDALLAARRGADGRSGGHTVDP